MTTSLRERALRWGLRAGWVIGPRIPAPAQRALWTWGAGASQRLGLATPAGWVRNATVVLGRPPTSAETRAAVASYLRYYVEMLALPGRERSELVSRVRVPDADRRALQDAVAGPGCVLALGHLGNWDWAGAWAAECGMPVATVAEELPGPEFQAFLDYRRGLGMRVYGHRDREAVDKLVADAADGHLVCLVADRDLKGRGVPVDWPTRAGAEAITMPVGPALVAQRSGAVLRALALHYDGRDLVFTLSEPIDVGEGPDGLRAATQAVADHLGAVVAEHVVDWHLFQPFFERG